MRTSESTTSKSCSRGARQRGVGRGGLLDAEAPLLEQRGEHLAHRAVVVDDQELTGPP